MYYLLWCFMYAAELGNVMTVRLLWYACRKRISHPFHCNLPLLLFGQKQPKWQLITVSKDSWQIKHVTQLALFSMNNQEWTTFLGSYEATSWSFCYFSINCVNLNDYWGWDNPSRPTLNTINLRVWYKLPCLAVDSNPKNRTSLAWFSKVTSKF